MATGHVVGWKIQNSIPLRALRDDFLAPRLFLSATTWIFVGFNQEIENHVTTCK
jgi:hypothetical protein